MHRQALWVGAVGTLLLPFLAAICVNHEVWGYYLSRPALDRRIVEARQIETITFLETESDSRGSYTFSGEPVAELDSFNQGIPKKRTTTSWKGESFVP